MKVGNQSSFFFDIQDQHIYVEFGY